jgi:hypothetical protein
VNLRGRLRALVSLLHFGDPSPIEVEGRHLAAWRVYTQAGIPAEPGWTAAAHQLDPRAHEVAATSALAVAADLERANGLVVLEGPIGSGRTYALCRVLWHRAQRFARHKVDGVGVWLDAGQAGSGDLAYWRPLERRALAASILVVDDPGAAGSSSAWATERLSTLLEARNRRQGLTMISTNLSSEEFGKIYGARLLDRCDWRVCPGASLRKGVRPNPRIPARITQAQDRKAASKVIEAATTATALAPSLDQEPEVARAVSIIEPWLRADRDAVTWEQLLEDTLAVATRQHAAVQAAIYAAAQKMSADGIESDAEQREREHRQRQAHAEKVAALLARDA